MIIRRIGLWSCLCAMLMCATVISFAEPSIRADSNDNTVAADVESAHDARHRAMKESLANPFGIGLYRPNYIFPGYYTTKPYYSIYDDKTPNQQKIHHWDVKFQLSLIFPMAEDILGSGRIGGVDVPGNHP